MRSHAASFDSTADPIRWSAVVTYRTDNGPDAVDHLLVELADIHDLIERGPHGDTIVGIEIKRHDPVHPDLTIEAALLQ